VRRLFIFIAALALAWVAGLAVFLAALPKQPPAPAHADGIVVYTGVGGARIATAMSLLGDGAGRRLLISGVNPQISRDEVAKLWPGEPSAFDCCVDLGLEARSTTGNAIEVREWARRNDFRSIILVTSDYHMPRALLETRAQIPDAEIVPYPVGSGLVGEGGLPSSIAACRPLAVEYTKYLAVRVKTLVRLG
jgi:uncharacterized SAM-binding protein YcdF (DUF218 family)